MKKIIKIIIVALLIIFIIFGLLLIINSSFVRYAVVDYFAPKSFGDCQKMNSEDAETRSIQSCYWNVSNNQLLKKLYHFLCYDTGEISDLKCQYTLLNPNYIFPKNYQECTKNYGNKYVCSMGIPGPYYQYYNSNFRKMTDDCRNAYGFLTEGEGCRVNFYTEKAYLPDSGQEEKNNNNSKCEELGGSVKQLRFLENYEYLMLCNLTFNSKTDNELFQECIKKSNHIISKGINDTEWCNYYYEFIKSASSLMNAI